MRGARSLKPCFPQTSGAFALKTPTLRARTKYDNLATNQVPIRAFIEALCAAHLSTYVYSPFSDVGGVIIVGPPGALKTTMLRVAVSHFPNVTEASDLNVTSLTDLRPAFAAKTQRTLMCPEFAKIYERDPRSAENVEGHIRALVDEGFRAPSFKNQQMARLTAHAVFLSAITEEFREDKYKKWNDSGFNRRFLWPLIRMARPEILEEAADHWKPLDFRMKYLPGLPVSTSIPNMTKASERHRIRQFLRFQPGPTHTTQAHLLTRMLAVLKWWYRIEERRSGSANQTMKLFCRTLAKEGAELVI